MVEVASFFSKWICHLDSSIQACDQRLEVVHFLKVLELVQPLIMFPFMLVSVLDGIQGFFSLLSITKQRRSDTTDFITNFITRPRNSRPQDPVFMRVFCVNETKLHDYIEMRCRHRGTFRGV